MNKKYPLFWGKKKLRFHGNLLSIKNMDSMGFLNGFFFNGI